MAADSQTFMIVQLLIASVACLCISLAYIWFLKNKIKKLTPGKNFVFEYAYDGSKAGKKDDDKKGQAEIDALGSLSGQQFQLSAQLKAMTAEKDVSSLSEKERQQLLDHINSLEDSLERSGRQIASMKNHYRKVKGQAAPVVKKVADKSKAQVPEEACTEESVSLVEQNKQLKHDIESKDKEIKKLRINSSLMTKELDDLKLENFDSYELKQSLEETEQKLKRSEAERELLENKFVEIAEGRSTRDLEEEISRIKKEYEMLEERFIGSGAA
jgi:hypothetical protein